MLGFSADPGDCLVCGTAHCACGGPVSIVVLAQRDAAAAQAVEPSVQSHEPPAELQRPADDGPESVMGDGPEPFTTSSYRGKPGRKSRR